MKKIVEFLLDQKIILVFPLLLTFSFLWWEFLNLIFSKMGVNIPHLTLFILAIITSSMGTYALWLKNFTHSFYSRLDIFEERSKNAQTSEELIEIKMDIALFLDTYKKTFPEMLDERDRILTFINTRLKYEFKKE